MMITRKLLLAVLILTGLLTACNNQAATPAATPFVGVKVKTENGGSYTNIAPYQLADMLHRKDFFLVNTHVPYEGEIDQTDALIPYDQTAQQLSKDPADKTAKIVLYCRSGRMSAIAAQELVKAGYTNVWNLEGGMIAWEKAGLSLTRK